MDSYISRAEYEEHNRRTDDEHARMNKRITQLEDESRQTRTLAISIEKMAVTMENMLAEQKRQGNRLDELEGVPAERSEKIRIAIVTGVITSIVTAIMAAIISIL